MKKNITVGIKFLPATTPENVHNIVDKAIKVIDSWNLKYKVGPSMTSVEGNLQDILKKVNSLCEYMEESIERFTVILDIDYCKNGISINDKIKKYSPI